MAVSVFLIPSLPHGDRACSIVIVHGGYHLASQYALLERALKKTGFSYVSTPQLPSAGHSPPDQPFTEDARTVSQAINAQIRDRGDVVVLAHSYGGLVATEALNHLEDRAGKLKGIVFVAAVVPEAGNSLVTAVIGGIADWVRLEGPLCFVNSPEKYFYNTLVDKETLENAIANVQPNAAASFLAPVGKASWKDYPYAYVKCTVDKATTPEIEALMVDRVQAGRSDVQVVELQSDHCPMLSAPEELAEIIRKFVDGLVVR